MIEIRVRSTAQSAEYGFHNADADRTTGAQSRPKSKKPRPAFLRIWAWTFGPVFRPVGATASPVAKEYCITRFWDGQEGPFGLIPPPAELIAAYSQH